MKIYLHGLFVSVNIFWQSLCALGCTYGDWTVWTACTAPCNGGAQYSYRLVMDGDCEAITANRTCNPQDCPVDCQTTEWMPWSRCVYNSDTFESTRFREKVVLLPPQGSGKECPKVIKEAELCARNHSIIDCMVNEWEDWTTCTKTCGWGTKSRRRDVIRSPSEFGQQCPFLEHIVRCLQQPCPQSAFCSKKPDGHYSYSEKELCSPVFYSCVSGEEFIRACPESLVFNALTGHCATPPKNCTLVDGFALAQGTNSAQAMLTYNAIRLLLLLTLIFPALFGAL